jgi:abhydrolase domain-containing protein 12
MGTCADQVPGRCSRLKLVFVHAENDTTMPWVETEELFRTTLKAAVEVTSPDDGIPRDLKVVDLGEAGRQEVWQSGSRCIQKTIAKHGGKRTPSPDPALTQIIHVWGRSWMSFLHNDDWIRLLCFALV